MASSNLPSLLPLLIVIVLISHHLHFIPTIEAQGTCHADDEAGLLAFKSGIGPDPSGQLASWAPGTRCCNWNGVTCWDGTGRVTGIFLFGPRSYGPPAAPPPFPSPAPSPSPTISSYISPSLSLLSNLQFLTIDTFPDLSGPLPDFLFVHPRLDNLRIINCAISGPLPTNISSATPVRMIILSNNRITGTIPPSISVLPQLTSLLLDGNLLTGKIPPEISRVQRMKTIMLDRNQLTGTIPDLSPLTDLGYLSLSNNKLTGRIPRSMAALSATVYNLDLGNNLLTRRIPDIFGNFTKLTTLKLSNNKLTGPVPESFGNLTQIDFLDLNHNSLIGPFPTLPVSRMSKLDLSYNRFRLRTIPEWVTNLTYINTLNLAKCGLQVSLQEWKPVEPAAPDIEDSEGSAGYSFIDLSHNHLRGSLAGLLNRTKYVVEFRAAGNQLKFNMTGMTFPSTLSLLDFSWNSIFGSVPPSITSLKEVNLSYNHLCGPLPDNEFPATAFVGNDCLCGPPLPPCVS